MKDNAYWIKEAMYCPNCGNLVMGYRNTKGLVKKRCERCGVLLYSKRITRRRIDIQVNKPS